MASDWDLEAAHQEGFLRAACASWGIEHGMDTVDVLAAYKAAKADNEEGDGCAQP